MISSCYFNIYSFFFQILRSQCMIPKSHFPRMSPSMSRRVFAPRLDKFIASVLRPSSLCIACRRKAFTTNHVRFSLTRPKHRNASTIVSVTAVNAKREVAPAFQILHAALKQLEKDAALFVNTSQLQLALRGLEGENAVTRVAGYTACLAYSSRLLICT